MQTAAINKGNVNSPETPILAQLGKLERSLDAIWDRLEHLEGRLVGVLAFDPPVPQKESPTCPQAPMSPIQARLTVFNDKTELILRKLAEIIDRSEV